MLENGVACSTHAGTPGRRLPACHALPYPFDQRLKPKAPIEGAALKPPDRIDRSRPRVVVACPYVDCPSCAAPPALGCGDGAADAGARRAVVRADECRYLSRDRSAGRAGGLELSGAVGLRCRAAHGVHQRARVLDHRQRHRAYRIGIDQRARHSEGLFPAGHRHRRGDRADERGLGDHPERFCRAAPSRRKSFPTTRATFRSRSSTSSAIRFRPAGCSTTASTSSASSSSRFPAFRRPRRSAACSARSWSTSTRLRSMPTGCPRSTSATRWPRPTWLSRRAPQRSATTSTTSIST